MLLLQKFCAAEHTALLPPLLQAMICALVKTCKIIPRARRLTCALQPVGSNQELLALEITELETRG
jgi:hypothetical protein